MRNTHANISAVPTKQEGTIREDTILALENVTLRYDGVKVLDNINFSLNASQILTIIGPNGAGKSSLIKTAIGLASPQSGRIIKKPGLRIGYMPQKISINAQLPLTTRRFLSLNGRKADFNHAVERLDIACLLNTPIQGLSGGEMQRVLLARALMKKPELLVLDEPAQGVDVVGQAELYHLLGELRNELHCGVLLVSHDLHIVMAQTDHVLCLNKHICCHGEPESVSQHPEYLDLFGQNAAQDIAVYTHDHDHSHDMHGDIVKGSSCSHP